MTTPDSTANAAWPIRIGAAPPLAKGFSPRPETEPGLAAALIPGSVVALVPATEPPDGSPPVGCGKTQLAAAYAGNLLQAGVVDLMVWVNATSIASVLSSYVEAAAAVGIGPDGPGEPAEQVAARFAAWLSQTSRPWLVVLDGLRDVAGLAGLWPAGPAGRVLVTTTDGTAVPAAAQPQFLPVGAYSPREAMMYVMGRLSADPDQRHGAIGLTEDLAGDPAALAQGASVIVSSAMMNCGDYQDHFALRQAQLAGPGGEQPVPVAVAWTLSLEQAERLSPGQATSLTLALAALLDGQGIPGAMFTTPAMCRYLALNGAAVGARAAWDAVLSLDRAGLVDIDEGTSPATVRVNRAVQAQVRTVTPEALRDQAARAAADALVQAWPAEEAQPWLAAGLRSCVASLLEFASDRLWASGLPHPVLLRAGQSLDAARLTGPAVSHWSQLAALSDKFLGPDSPGTLAAGSQLARALLGAGQAAEAVAWWQWAVAGQTRISGPEHPDTLGARVSLGATMTAAGQPGAAIAVLREAVAACERAAGPDHLDTLAARDELAAAVRAAGDLPETITLYQRTLADRERVQGAHHPDVIAVRDKLAQAHLDRGKPKDAVALYKRTLADQERALGRDHLDTIGAQANLAAAYYAGGKVGTALQLQEEACSGYERVLGPDHTTTLTRRAELAQAYYNAGRFADATVLLRETIERCERVLPSEHPLTRSVRQTMTSLIG